MIKENDNKLVEKKVQLCTSRCWGRKTPKINLDDENF